eukprot:COSAG01_NODE_1211_length_11216_cov_47.562562_1_plen_162_part_00
MSNGNASRHTAVSIVSAHCLAILATRRCSHASFALRGRPIELVGTLDAPTTIGLPCWASPMSSATCCCCCCCCCCCFAVRLASHASFALICADPPPVRCGAARAGGLPRPPGLAARSIPPAVSCTNYARRNHGRTQLSTQVRARNDSCTRGRAPALQAGGT